MLIQEECLSLETLLEFIRQYGYTSLFWLLVLGIVGLPVPDETLLTYTGFLVYQGHLTFTGALTAGFLGSVTGISISYLLGRWLGLPLVRKYGRYIRFTEDKLDKVHAWFHRIGRWTLTFGYYIPGVRHFTAYTAGTAGMPYLEFAAFAYSGGLLWVTTFISLGYYFGDQWEQILGILHKNVAGAAVAALILLAGYLLWRRHKRRQEAAAKKAANL
jgi:membrane protein DedA with SNARE-associated domain